MSIILTIIFILILKQLKAEYYLRIVNMFDKTQLNQENVWEIVKQTRKSFLSLQTDPCKESDTQLSENFIKVNNDIVQEKLELKTFYDSNKTVSDKTLQVAAEMFIYLNYCPRYISFLEDLIKYDSAKNILLALTSMIQTSQNAAKESSTKVFLKALELFELSYYKDVDLITKETGVDNYQNNVKSFNETLSVLGK